MDIRNRDAVLDLEGKVTCSKCGYECDNKVKSCPECGAAAAAPPPPVVAESPASGWSSGTLAAGGVLAVALVIWAIHTGEASDAGQAPASAAPRTYHVTGAMACASSRDDVDLVAQAYSHRDSDAVVGLVGRQKAIALAAGTSVTVILEDTPYQGIDFLSVDSGSYIGERYYGLAAFLARD